ncbi:sensor domain-containing protein [Streptomyces sp. LX-29]|uniref:sensor domain-containing protein n=1 Tax=Streptomyces sp. LX-29 TaxID=2900152 RepID=UPI00240D981B|nr:sensor domain-containing protein [Streptomyces sp. LX-29]WFB09392.1 sensor domain-containing protein [Streptomyces sp. LX-29]
MTEMTSPHRVPYATASTTSTVSIGPHAGRFGRFGRELGYLLTGLPLGIAAFVVAVAGFSFGLGTLVVWLGLPVLVGLLRAARGFARVERRRVESATGRALPPHHYRERGGSGFGGLVRALGDPQSWRDLLHMVVAFPARVVGFCLALTWTVGTVGELLYVTWSWAVPRDGDDQTLLDLMFGVDSRVADIAFNTGIGVLMAASAIPVIRALVALQSGLARGLLTNRYAAERARR